jgi:HEAT repeat protein
MTNDDLQQFEALSAAQIQIINHAIVRISQGAAVGSGFFIMPGIVLTCAHVHDPSDPGALHVQWGQEQLTVRKVTRLRPESDPDLELLYIDRTDHPVLSIAASSYAFFPFYSWGFQFEDRGYSGYPSRGECTGFAPLKDDSNSRLLVLSREAAVKPGLSGSPVYSLLENKVVGVIKRSNPDGGGYAVPVEEVEMLHPGILAANAMLTGDRRDDGLAAYIAALQTEHSRLAFANLYRDIQLDAIYVTLTLAANSHDGSTAAIDAIGSVSHLHGSLEARDRRRDRGSSQPWFRQPEVSIGDLLSSGCAVILGEPGAGKTTLLRHILSRTCRGELFRGSVPIFVRAAALNDRPGCLRHYLAETYEHVSPVLEKALREGRVVLFLDGLDEASRAAQSRIIDELNRLLASCNKIFVSCRTVSYPRGQLPGAFRLFECIGFNRSQRNRFLLRWFNDDPARASELEHYIDSNVGMTKFGQNPLMLSLLAAAHETHGAAGMPPRRVQIYELLMDTLFSRYTATGEAGDSRFSRALKRNFLAWLALELMTNGQETFNESNLFILWERFVASNGLQSAQPQAPDALLNELVHHDSILLLGPGREYYFLHRTFQEYFAAAELYGHGDLARPLAHVHDPRWEEVVRLYCGMLSEADAEYFLVRLLESTQNASHNTAILTARCATETFTHTCDLTDALVNSLFPIAFASQSPVAIDAFHALAGLCASFPEYLEDVRGLLPSTPDGSLNAAWIRRYVEFLGLVGSDDAAQLLIDQLGFSLGTGINPMDEDRILILVSILEALGSTGRSIAVPYLEALLEHWSSAVSGAAGRALSDIPLDDLAAERLRTYLSQPANVRVLRAPLAMRLKSSSLVRQALYRIFAADPDPLAQIAVRHAVDLEWVEGGVEFHNTLMDAVDDNGLANLLSIRVLGVYVDGPDNVRALIFDDTRPLRVRAAAVNFVINQYPALAADITRNLLARGDRTLVRAVLVALAGSGNSQLHEMLTDAAKAATQDWIRVPLLRLFSQIPTQACQPWLRQQATDDRDSRTAMMALLALADLKDAWVLPNARDRLRTGHTPAWERVAAYRALARLATRRACTVMLASIAREADPAVTTKAIEQLCRVRDVRVESMLLSLLSMDGWPSAWPPRAPAPGRGEQRPSDGRLLAAVIGLGSVGSSQAIAPLEELSQRENEDVSIRHAAYRAVWTIRSQR